MLEDRGNDQLQDTSSKSQVNEPYVDRRLNP